MDIYTSSLYRKANSHSLCSLHKHSIGNHDKKAPRGTPSVPITILDINYINLIGQPRISFEGCYRSTGQLAEAVVFAVTIAFACTCTTPEWRPTMHSVAQELPDHTHALPSEPFDMITNSKLIDYQK